MTTINEDIARAQLLLGNFEKGCSFNSGYRDLLEALQILSDIRDFSSDASIKSRADNLILLYSKFAKSKINAILQNPNEYKPVTLAYWGRVVDNLIPFTGDEFISAKEALAKHAKEAKWEELSWKKQINSILNSLSVEERKALCERLKELKQIKNTMNNEGVQ